MDKIHVRVMDLFHGLDLNSSNHRGPVDNFKQHMFMRGGSETIQASVYKGRLVFEGQHRVAALQELITEGKLPVDTTILVGSTDKQIFGGVELKLRKLIGYTYDELVERGIFIVPHLSGKFQVYRRGHSAAGACIMILNIQGVELFDSSDLARKSVSDMLINNWAGVHTLLTENQNG